MNRAYGILKDTTYTLDCLADASNVDDIYNHGNGYWESAERCRSNAEANADYVRNFIDDTLVISDDEQVFILDQLARIVEWYRTKDHR